jgi:hypothetical protein
MIEEFCMFKVRVIPCLDVKDGRVVKGINFVDLRDAGDPVEAASAGKSSPMAAVIPRGSMPSNTPRRSSRSAPAKSC